MKHENRKNMGISTMLMVVLVVLVLADAVVGDQYLHTFRGSNNRLNEQTANRANGNRLFDSQNNNKGGYNVGDLTDQAANSEAQQGPMHLYEESKLMLEWTNQHACGDNPKVRCEHIIQIMCDDEIRNGITTNTPPENADDQSTGRHESRQWYADCKTRERNKGLFTADQNLNGETAIYTRQNPNGNRRGYECPEERDYYPYWIENPWTDIAILTSNTSRCDWYEEALEGLERDVPPCIEAVWSRDNHLGNTRDGYHASYNWTLPTTQEACGKDDEPCKCVLRIRYNISTTDYDWDLNATFNGEASPVQQNPVVDIGVMQGFQLAINTAQTGRTFQDRSHVFYIEPRPSGLGDDVIHNIVVRGKRGNIVQTYPAVEYDFSPNKLYVGKSDWVHWQWTGSNTHNNNAPAGDGQAGDDGQGTGGTDRSNVVELRDLNENYPCPFQHTRMWKNVRKTFPAGIDPQDLATQLATVGVGAGVQQLLNNAPAYFSAPLVKFNPGEYFYFCTRNNNVSNRGQKGTLIVE